MSTSVSNEPSLSRSFRTTIVSTRVASLQPNPGSPPALQHSQGTPSAVQSAGSGPHTPGEPLPVGKVGEAYTLEEAYQHARTIGLIQIARMKEALGDLDRVKRIVKVLGMVNAVPEFGDQPKVINGFSDLMVELYGDAGRHARSAVGKISLPFGMAVEIEAIFEVD